MEMENKKQETLPSNVQRWICGIKEEIPFVIKETVELVKSEENPADLLSRFTTQGEHGRGDTPYSNDIDGS